MSEQTPAWSHRPPQTQTPAGIQNYNSQRAQGIGAVLSGTCSRGDVLCGHSPVLGTLGVVVPGQEGACVFVIRAPLEVSAGSLETRLAREPWLGGVRAANAHGKPNGL